MRSTSHLVWLAAMTLLVLAGCGGGKGNLQQPVLDQPLNSQDEANGLEGLVSPAQALKDLAFVGEERLLTGSQFNSGLSSAHAEIQGSSCLMTPAYSLPDNTALKDAAYAIYSFNIPGYTGDPVVEVSWDSPPADLGKLFFGVGNFPLNRWDWKPAPVDGLINLDDLANHQSPTGVILIAVVLTGEDPATLGWLKVGANVGPDASFSADPVSGMIPLAIDFDASESVDYDGNIVSYEWDLDADGTFESGPVPENTTSLTYLIQGSYDVVLRVTDDLGEIDTAIVTVNANVPGNQFPSASVSAEPTSGPAPLIVDFDGSVSNDPDGTIDLYEWDWDNDGIYDESSPSDPLAAHTFVDVQVHTVVLRVTDNQGVTDTASVSITVEEGGEPNENPTALLTANPMNQWAPLLTNFDATGSFDTDGTIVKYEFDWESSGDFIELPAETQHTYTLAGNHDCTLRVTDDLGGIGLYTLRVTANGGNYSEYENNDDAASANAVPNINFSGFTASLGLPGYDGDDDDWYEIYMVENFQYRIFMSGFLDDDADLDMKLLREDGTTSIKTASSTSDDEEILWVCDSTGKYYLHCYVYLEGSSDYTLEITAILLVPPVADIQASPTNGDWPLTVNFDASGSTDADGTIVKYEWDFDGNGTYEINGDTEPTYTHEFTDAGVFNATVRVTDDTSATDTASIEITVANDPPVASFTALPTSGSRPLTVEFDASASYDPDIDGGIARYEWDFDGDGRIDFSKTNTSDDPPLATGIYYALGTYDATLIVTDVAGATDSTTREITVTGTADNETEPNNDEDIANTAQDAAAANSLPAFPFSLWYGVVGPKPVDGGSFGDPDDWYFFNVGSTGDVDILLEFYDNVCDIDLQLYAQGDYESTLASSGGTSDEEQISISLDAGNYYLRVWAYTGDPAKGGYRISGTFTP